MKKRLLTILLAVSVISTLTIAGCSGGNGEEKRGDQRNRR